MKTKKTNFFPVLMRGSAKKSETEEFLCYNIGINQKKIMKNKKLNRAELIKEIKDSACWLNNAVRNGGGR